MTISDYVYGHLKNYGLDKYVTQDKLKKIGLILTVKFGAKPVIKFIIKKLDLLEDRIVDEFESLPFHEQALALLKAANDHKKTALMAAILGAGVVYAYPKAIRASKVRRRSMRRDTVVEYILA